MKRVRENLRVLLKQLVLMEGFGGGGFIDRNRLTVDAKNYPDI